MISELEKKRAMESVSNLLDLAIRNPRALNDLTAELAGSGDPYSEESSMYYLMGLIHGAAISAVSSPMQAINSIRHGHATLMDLKPKDYIGPRRLYGKTNSTPRSGA